MVTIRLARKGSKNQPFYHVMVTDKRRRQGGASLEQVGFFNPKAKGAEIRLRLDLPRIEYWTGQGAELSDRVKSLVVAHRKAQGATTTEAAAA